MKCAAKWLAACSALLMVGALGCEQSGSSKSDEGDKTEKSDKKKDDDKAEASASAKATAAAATGAGSRPCPPSRGSGTAARACLVVCQAPAAQRLC